MWDKTDAQLETFIKNVHNFVVQVDEKGTFHYVSPSSKRVLGYELKELTGSCGFNLLHPEDRDKLKAPLADALNGKNHSLDIPECRLRHADGHYLWIEAVGEAVYDDSGRFRFVILFIRDITRRKIREEEMLRAAKLDSIVLLAGGIAHDFNNLLAVVLGNISLAKLSLNRPHQILDRLEKMEKATLQARDLSVKMLAFSRGDLPEREIIYLDRLIQEASYLALSGSNIKCEMNLSDQLLPVRADAGQMSQVISNILLNAAQAMPEGGIVRIKAAIILLADDSAERRSVQLPAGEYVKLSVTDEGPGIPGELINRIFEPFFTTKQHGYGLGLPSAYSIVQKHSGCITVESRPGQGATFNVYLPASREHAADAVRETEVLIPGRGKVLAMDDNERVREVLGDMLAQLGYEVSFAPGGAEAVELYRRHLASGSPFDVVIMDLTVPGGSGGKSAVKKLFALNPQVKAIVTSGYANNPVMLDYKTHGFQDFIIKPYTIESLSCVLNRVLQNTQ